MEPHQTDHAVRVRRFLEAVERNEIGEVARIFLSKLNELRPEARNDLARLRTLLGESRVASEQFQSRVQLNRFAKKLGFNSD
jgi:hypothetical protein